MAGAGLLTLLDDIATVLDDISVMTKVAARKTAGVLGDDLALNAQQVLGVERHRNLPGRVPDTSTPVKIRPAPRSAPSARGLADARTAYPHEQTQTPGTIDEPADPASRRRN